MVDNRCDGITAAKIRRVLLDIVNFNAHKGLGAGVQ